ncbi:MAG TPA: hypothetical protein VFN35_16115, partial [Ktedonobacteraceae bacterium]|nr:hypothetical protein [Ktedonobacteraceae bacterium]
MAAPSVETSVEATSRRRLQQNRGGGGSSRRQREETRTAYLFLAPYIFVLVVFFALVAIYGIGLSFFSIDLGFTPPEFVGFHNYQVLFNQLFTNPSLSP